jgi:biotin carboxylase
MKRLLLFLPTTTYRTEAFVEAARRVGVNLTVASEQDSAFSEQEPARLITLDFRQPERAAVRVVDFAERYPVHAVFGVDDDTALAAAVVSRALGLPHNPVNAMAAARDKHRQRCLLRDHRVPVPEFSLHSLTEPAEQLAQSVPYPCVLKPTSLAASRGVIRANDPAEFLDAHRRLAAILAAPDVVERGEGIESFLVERFVRGPEYALEGLLVQGQVRVLALFDKPDPLDGPFFAETIYVTPSRTPSATQRALVKCTEDAVRAVGLERGPIHAELRVNEEGPWLVELAARPIGGKCGRVLRFGNDGGVSLEELLLRDALGELGEPPCRAGMAAGVLMIPVPQVGRLAEVRGIDDALAVRHVTDVIITAHRGQQLIPLPEESRYLGFVFASAPDPAAVEESLRAANAQLRIIYES